MKPQARRHPLKWSELIFVLIRRDLRVGRERSAHLRRPELAKESEGQAAGTRAERRTGSCTAALAPVKDALAQIFSHLRTCHVSRSTLFSYFLIFQQLNNHLAHTIVCSLILTTVICCSSIMSKTFLPQRGKGTSIKNRKFESGSNK